MPKIYKIVIIMFILLLFPINIYAIYVDNDERCTIDELARMKKMASNVNFSTSYKETNGTIVFDVKIANVYNEVYIIDIFKDQRISSYSQALEDKIITGYLPNSNLRYEIYSSSGICQDQILMVKYVNIPPYNPFYNDPVCAGVTGFTLCNKWANNKYSYAEFVNLVNKYKNKEETVVPDEKEKEVTIIEIILDFIAKYYAYVLGIIIIGGVAIIVWQRKRDDFDL